MKIFEPRLYSGISWYENAARSISETHLMLVQGSSAGTIRPSSFSDRYLIALTTVSTAKSETNGMLRKQHHSHATSMARQSTCILRWRVTGLSAWPALFPPGLYHPVGERRQRPDSFSLRLARIPPAFRKHCTAKLT